MAGREGRRGTTATDGATVEAGVEWRRGRCTVLAGRRDEGGGRGTETAEEGRGAGTAETAETEMGEGGA